MTYREYLYQMQGLVEETNEILNGMYDTGDIDFMHDYVMRYNAELLRLLREQEQGEQEADEVSPE